MSTRLEDYALIGDCHSAALISREGSIDWLCWPRFDSDACFAALLGSPDHGRWALHPVGVVRSTQRRYMADTLVLETRHETATGTVSIIDFMRHRDGAPALFRIAKCAEGIVSLRTVLTLRFGYGYIVPWVRRIEDGVEATAGPDLVRLQTPVPLRGEGLSTVGDVRLAAGDSVSFVLTWQPSHAPQKMTLDAEEALRTTTARWREWVRASSYDGLYTDAVRRSLITLKALTYRPTGGIVAAPTTSLPEWPGASRNWDYRYCWLRDATFTLYSLMNSGFTDEARAWREWLLRAVAGVPSQMGTVYGLAGERRLPELEIDWLPGYESSRPVRVGNAASTQFQLDVWGEVLDAFHVARRAKLVEVDDSWHLQLALLSHLETVWSSPDSGIWEVRGPARQFTHSKAMAWVAFDRAVRAVTQYGLAGPVERWSRLRDEIHSVVCDRGFSLDRGAFVQEFGGTEVDASLLMLPLFGFLPPDDPRMLATVAAIERDLLVDGLVARYAPRRELDGQPEKEGVFLPCSFWLVDNYVLQGRHDEARGLFERLLGLSNDVGLLSEEFDPVGGRMLGNFPQAFSHVSLVNTAHNLSGVDGPAKHRCGGIRAGGLP